MDDQSRNARLAELAQQATATLHSAGLLVDGCEVRADIAGVEIGSTIRSGLRREIFFYSISTDSTGYAYRHYSRLLTLMASQFSRLNFARLLQDYAPRAEAYIRDTELFPPIE